MMITILPFLFSVSLQLVEGRYLKKSNYGTYATSGAAVDYSYSGGEDDDDDDSGSSGLVAGLIVSFVVLAFCLCNAWRRAGGECSCHPSRSCRCCCDVGAAARSKRHHRDIVNLLLMEEAMQRGHDYHRHHHHHHHREHHSTTSAHNKAQSAQQSSHDSGLEDSKKQKHETATPPQKEDNNQDEVVDATETTCCQDTERTSDEEYPIRPAGIPTTNDEPDIAVPGDNEDCRDNVKNEEKEKDDETPYNV